jgi:phenylalanyl-tRNA synthetase beta chain
VVLADAEAPKAVAVWRELAAVLGVGARIDQQRVPPGLHPTRSATLVAGRDAIGAVGEVAPGVLEAYGVDERVAILELDLSVVLAAEDKPARWKATSRHPSSDLDLAFALDEEIPAEKLEKAIRQGAGSLLVGLELFDVYRGTGLADGTRSLAYRLRLQAPDRTLTDSDTASVVAQVRAAAEKLGATLRA